MSKSTTSIRSFDLETKQGKLFNALVIEKQALTKSAIKNRFGIANPTATVSNIRQRGYAIYANQRKAGNGVHVTEYSHGAPSRRMVALAYKAQGMGITV
jgi:hypothetical protein